MRMGCRNRISFICSPHRFCWHSLNKVYYPQEEKSPLDDVRGILNDPQQCNRKKAYLHTVHTVREKYLAIADGY